MRFRKIADSIGAVAVEAIVEGRMCIIVDHSQNHNYGSRTDLVGCRVPATADEAKEALYLAAFSVIQQEPPIYVNYPANPSNLRQGFAGNSNLPFNADVYTTAPSMLQGRTIPSGALVALHAGGTYTVTSGNYVYSASLVPGARMNVTDTASDGAGEGGKLEYLATAGEGTATVIQHDTTKRELTFRTRQP
jgi:hypothetical protein